MRKRVAVLISGRGSNLKALLDARQDAYEIVLVISNIPDAGGLEIARAARVAALTIDHKPFGKDREAFEREVDAAISTMATGEAQAGAEAFREKSGG